jgi:hypothetical protein
VGVEVGFEDGRGVGTSVGIPVDPGATYTVG